MDPVLYWLMAFLLVILAKIYVLRKKGIRKGRDSMFFTEAIGLPLTFVQPVVFAKALLHGDVPGMLLTLWWGPGFIVVVVLVLWSKARKASIDWSGSEIYISWICKLTYLMYLGCALLWHMPKLVFALSAWIASDQIEKAFTALDADRARRSFHDFWLLRLLYPVFLLSPWWTGMSALYRGYGSLLFVLWALGLAHVWRQKEFMNLPQDPSLLRNMMYFRRSANCKESNK